MSDITTNGDVRIAGAGTVASGTYDTVNIAGTASLVGDIVCDSLKVNGAADGRGTLKAGTIVVNGAFTYVGDAESRETKVSGSAKFDGALEAKKLVISGSADVGKDLGGDEVKVHGYLNVRGDCAVERFGGEGGFTIDGLLNAGSIDVTLWTKCRAGDIGGEAINVRFGRSSLRRIVAMFVPVADIRLVTETVEGDHVRLEHTTARVVRGKSVVIGPGCDIGLVEYSDEYSAASDAKVKEARKMTDEGSTSPQD